MSQERETYFEPDEETGLTADDFPDLKISGESQATEKVVELSETDGEKRQRAENAYEQLFHGDASNFDLEDMQYIPESLHNEALRVLLKSNQSLDSWSIPQHFRGLNDSSFNLLLKSKSGGDMGYSFVAECLSSFEHLGRDKAEQLIQHNHVITVIHSLGKFDGLDKEFFMKALESVKSSDYIYFEKEFLDYVTPEELIDFFISNGRVNDLLQRGYLRSEVGNALVQRLIDDGTEADLLKVHDGLLNAQMSMLVAHFIESKDIEAIRTVADSRMYLVDRDDIPSLLDFAVESNDIVLAKKILQNMRMTALSESQYLFFLKNDNEFMYYDALKYHENKFGIEVVESLKDKYGQQKAVNIVIAEADKFDELPLWFVDYYPENIYNFNRAGILDKIDGLTRTVFWERMSHHLLELAAHKNRAYEISELAKSLLQQEGAMALGHDEQMEIAQNYIVDKDFILNVELFTQLSSEEKKEISEKIIGNNWNSSEADALLVQFTKWIDIIGVDRLAPHLKEKYTKNSNFLRDLISDPELENYFASGLIDRIDITNELFRELQVPTSRLVVEVLSLPKSLNMVSSLVGEERYRLVLLSALKKSRSLLRDASINTQARSSLDKLFTKQELGEIVSEYIPLINTWEQLKDELELVASLGVDISAPIIRRITASIKTSQVNYSARTEIEAIQQVSNLLHSIAPDLDLSNIDHRQFYASLPSQVEEAGRVRARGDAEDAERVSPNKLAVIHQMVHNHAGPNNIPVLKAFILYLDGGTPEEFNSLIKGVGDGLWYSLTDSDRDEVLPSKQRVEEIIKELSIMYEGSIIDMRKELGESSGKLEINGLTGLLENLFVLLEKNTGESDTRSLEIIGHIRLLIRTNISKLPTEQRDAAYSLDMQLEQIGTNIMDTVREVLEGGESIEIEETIKVLISECELVEMDGYTNPKTRQIILRLKSIRASYEDKKMSREDYLAEAGSSLDQFTDQIRLIIEKLESENKPIVASLVEATSDPMTQKKKVEQIMSGYYRGSGAQVVDYLFTKIRPLLPERKRMPVSAMRDMLNSLPG